ncbi:hypothetical protein OS493_013139 [Desmophyllum pertusum]|uniref:Nucleolar protein Dnt1-like N-terminal domain-containing protein n=1 Tax=Desmophyllum pertusum TaxID=174260 RepID=A0A9W9YPZ3_9CNID|nr:hypothetical protein OS493_013139 [Desmophyllum pertusum]
MARKLRVNVVCSSRDKRFLVLAEGEWTLGTFRENTEDIFHRLYPEEPQLRISSLQNEFHFDLPLSYKVDEALIDTGLVFVMEKEVSLLTSLSQVSNAETKSKTHKYTNRSDMQSNDDSTQPSPRKRAKVVKKTSRLAKIRTSHPGGMADCSSNNRVTSTTSPTLTEQEASLTPQIVEKISEDSEVDIESVDDSTAQLQGALNNIAPIKRKAPGRKTSQKILRKARKIKSKTKNSTAKTNR